MPCLLSFFNLLHRIGNLWKKCQLQHIQVQCIQEGCSSLGKVAHQSQIWERSYGYWRCGKSHCQENWRNIDHWKTEEIGGCKYKYEFIVLFLRNDSFLFIFRKKNVHFYNESTNHFYQINWAGLRSCPAHSNLPFIFTQPFLSHCSNNSPTFSLVYHSFLLRSPLFSHLVYSPAFRFLLGLILQGIV